MVLTPVMIKKSLSELKFQSRILFSGVCMLLMVLFLMQFQEPIVFEYPINEVKRTEKIIDSMNISITSYGYVINLFPI